MNSENNHGAVKPEDALPVKARPIDDTPDLTKTEFAIQEAPTPPKSAGDEPDEAKEQTALIDPEESQPTVLTLLPPFEATGIVEHQIDPTELPSESVEDEAPLAEKAPSTAEKAVSPPRKNGFSREQPPQLIQVAPHVLRHRTRRDVLLFGAGAIAALAGVGSLLPQATLKRLGIDHGNNKRPKRERLLNKALRFDDDVAEALYSKDRLVPTYTKSQITPLRNNYNGATPDRSYIPEWRLTLDGLASGLSVSLNIRNLLTSFRVHEQITRLVCVEGWSAIAWWAGFRFDELLRAYPPVSQAKWARLESTVNLGPWGNPDPYFVSLDLSTADHPQTLLATHLNGKALTVEHGAPLRLLVPVKLGLKNIKAITRITYTKDEPADYWAKRGYSHYDGI
jgi:DMSO/TMAO reductase YedYZ molybdopterin-dependent catalytic subunit